MRSQSLIAVILCGAALPLLSCDDSVAGLIGRWTFDDSGDRTADTSGKGNDLTNVGTVGYVSGGVSGDAMSVNNGGKAFHGYGATADMSELTISLWADLQGGSLNTFDDYWEIGSPGGSDGYVLENTNGNDPDGFNIGGFTGASAVNTVTTPDLSGGGYHHLVMTMSASGNAVNLYIDGVLNESDPWSATANLNFVTIGGRFNVGNRNIDADIDEVQIYNEALTADEVLTLFNNPTAIIPEPATLALAGLGLLGLITCTRRRKRAC